MSWINPCTSHGGGKRRRDLGLGEDRHDACRAGRDEIPAPLGLQIAGERDKSREIAHRTEEIRAHRDPRSDFRMGGMHAEERRTREGEDPVAREHPCQSADQIDGRAVQEEVRDVPSRPPDAPYPIVYDDGKETEGAKDAMVRVVRSRYEDRAGRMAQRRMSKAGYAPVVVHPRSDRLRVQTERRHDGDETKRAPERRRRQGTRRALVCDVRGVIERPRTAQQNRDDQQREQGIRHPAEAGRTKRADRLEWTAAQRGHEDHRDESARQPRAILQET
ncbi:MAG: hypothetical protein HY216_00850 [Candidatus Rokubacteria bacterium]|nr:hypothetical protein [Candidatus Rokubacteria bacterium]